MSRNFRLMHGKVRANNMIEHNLLQGSDSWHEFRLNHYGASECAAMLGLSKKVTRTELLHAKSTGIAKEFSAWVQENVLDYGHEVEAMARPLVEKMIAKKLYPLTCSDGKLSASVDGITMAGGTAWENKQWNSVMPAMVAAGEVPEEHMPQCQQVLMVTGADILVFTMTDGTEENFVSTNVHPDQAWFERIRAGWAQFQVDVENFVPVEVIEKNQPDAIRQLPAVLIRASGQLAESNLHELTPQYDSFIEKAENKLATIDIANGKAIAKFSRAAAADLLAKTKDVVDQIVSVSDVVKTMEFYAGKLNKLGLDYEKAVDRMQKAEAEAALIKVGVEYAEHVDMLEIATDPIKLVVEKPNFAGALRSLKTPESKNAALNAALANAKVAASTVANEISGKLFWFNSNHKDNTLLFPDLQTVVYKPSEDFKLLVASRIDKHNAAEDARRVAEREQIRIEEEAKAKAKIEAEARAKALADEALSATQFATLSDKTEADAKAKRIQDDLQEAHDRRLKNETETEQVANKFDGEVHGVVANEKPAAKSIRPDDKEIIKAVMNTFGVSMGTACDWILSVAENMKAAA